jgi:SAM-dependent methyltransferase
VDDASRHRLARTFDSAAGMYARARPTYADSAIDWALPTGTRRVLDLAAGTGKLTALLVERGLEVVAVDRSTSMLAELRSALPSVDVRNATAEATGLPEASVDAVVIGTALHWFDRPAADVEMARVLRPGGVVADFTNRRDQSVAWVRDLTGLLGEAAAADARPLHDRGGNRLDPAFFAPPERRAFPFRQRMNAELLADLVATRSYVIAMPPARREALLASVRDLADTHAELRGRAEFELPYVTVVSRSVQTLRS